MSHAHSHFLLVFHSLQLVLSLHTLSPLSLPLSLSFSLSESLSESLLSSDVMPNAVSASFMQRIRNGVNLVAKWILVLLLAFGWIVDGGEKTTGYICIVTLMS